MLKPVVVVGAGGFGREVLDVLEAINHRSGVERYEILGVIDDSPSAASLTRLAKRGYRHLGRLDDWLGRRTSELYVVAIGNPAVRKRICVRVASEKVLEPLTVVHPNAVVGSEVRIGKGSVICAGVNVSTNVDIGDHVHLNPGAIIGHDTTIRNFVSINPGAVVSGEVTVESGSLIGAGATVLQGLTVGAGSTVGAGGVVTRDVKTGLVVKGVPAR